MTIDTQSNLNKINTILVRYGTKLSSIDIDDTMSVNTFRFEKESYIVTKTLGNVISIEKN